MREAVAITRRTLIPIGFAITMFGGVSWLTALYTATVANASEINKLEQSHTKLVERLVDQNEQMIDRLGRIEERLNHIGGNRGN